MFLSIVCLVIYNEYRIVSKYSNIFYEKKNEGTEEAS
jgi:hypothetical protein